MPAGGELGERRTGRAGGEAGADLDEIDRDAEILDQRALDLARERTQRYANPVFSGGPWPSWLASSGRPVMIYETRSVSEIGGRTGLLERELRRAQLALDMGDDRDVSLRTVRTTCCARISRFALIFPSYCTVPSKTVKSRVTGSDFQGIIASQRLYRARRIVSRPALLTRTVPSS